MTLNRAYLDWNASAPLRPDSRDAVVHALDVCGNASSVHAEGRHARAIIETAREQVASLVNAKPSEVVFTSGATESNNWVVAGGWDTIMRAGIEHDSILAPAHISGARNVGLSVDRNGEVDVAPVTDVPVGRTLLTLQLANNETGVVQDVAKVAAEARSGGFVVHTDAVQAPGRIVVDFLALGVQAMSLSSHKIGGPKGVGALVVSGDVDLAPFVRGGGQEHRRRAGTENIAGIAGFGAAAAAARRDLANAHRVKALRDQLESDVLAITRDATVIGRDAGLRLPNTTCLALPGALAETLVIKLDLAGVAVSAGSACSSGKVGPSRVLAAMDVPADLARSAIRVSIGMTTTEREVAMFVDAWRNIAARRMETRKVA